MATSTEENLYNLIPAEDEKRHKSQKYVSQFRSTAAQEYASNRYPHRTMGEAKASVQTVDNFLKKHTRDEIAKKAALYCKGICEPGCGKQNGTCCSKGEQQGECSGKDYSEECCGDQRKCGTECKSHYPCEQRRAPVPKASEKPLMGVTTGKNFLKQNAVENIMSVSKKAERAFVDRRLGDRFLLEPSGLDPVYIKKKDFGRVPDYLDSRKKELEKAREDYDNYMREMQKRGELYKMSEEERQATIDGLKRNWEDLHRAYQSLGVMVDTLPKQHRKQHLETEMKILEKDIETLERHRHIYVAN